MMVHAAHPLRIDFVDHARIFVPHQAGNVKKDWLQLTATSMRKYVATDMGDNRSDATDPHAAGAADKTATATGDSVG